MEIITSSDNQIVKHARSLLEKKYRRESGHFLLEGPKQIADAIRYNFVIEKLFVRAIDSQKFDNIISSCNAQVYFVAENVFKSLCNTQTPQGIVAEVLLPQVKPYKYSAGDKLLVLDRIADPGNMGTIIRTAKATGFDHIFAIDCVDAYSPKVVRSSSGTILSSNVYPVSEDAIISYLNKHGVELIVADMNGQNIFDFNPSGDYAVVIGNEGSGVSQELKSAGTLVKLPMKPGIESLNAGVSASVIMYALKSKSF